MNRQRDRVGRLDADDGDSLFPHRALEHPNPGLEDIRSSTLDALCDAAEGDHGDGAPDEAAKSQGVQGDDRGGRTRVALGDSHVYLCRTQVAEDNDEEGSVDSVEATNV